MATIKTFSQVSQSLINNIALTQPALDTKPGTVSRDLAIDNVADQLATIYRNMSAIQKTQSLLNATGKTLDQFGSNYGITRDPGQNATGNAVLTFNTLVNNINIASGTTVTAKTGVVFQITSSIIVQAATKGVYSSYASSISDSLNIAGITDQYAIQVPVQALTVGANGNIPTYSLISTTIPGITNVTNIAPTSGGTNPQGDPQYLNEILAGLSGSDAGTARGYQNALASVSGVQSSYVAVAGDPILTRDGTTTQRNADGTLTVISPGTGGKVDIWIQGSDFINITETYVFHDVSGTGNITSPLDAHIIGQTTTTANLTPLERRQIYTNTGVLPLQPVDSLISLSGSVSGSNFVQGVNYELVKDTNPSTENTGFALDQVQYLQNFVSIVGENVAKGNSNSVDTLVFSGIKSINNVYQSVMVTNDLATLSSADHTQITISHKPLNTVSRATNLTTGERYVITDQNIDPTTGLNLTGEVTIDGSILPSPQDLIQVDYTWDFTYDQATDYFAPGTLQFATTGIDWGKSNYISQETGLLIRNGNRYNIGLTRNIDRVYTAFFCDTQKAVVQQASLINQVGVVKALSQITLTTGSGPVLYFVVPNTAPGFIGFITSGVSIGDKLIVSLDTAGTARNGTYTVASITDEYILEVQAVSPALVIESGNATIQINDPTDINVVMAAISITGLQTTAANISNIIDVVSVISNVTGLELYTTQAGGTFSGNVIYLATDVDQPAVGESVTAYFNSYEVYNIANNNGSVSGTNVILSTDDVLSFNSVLEPLSDIFNGANVKTIFVDYVATDVDVVVRTPMTSMPFIGSPSTSTLVDKNANPLTSRQPVEFDGSGNIIRSGPSYLSLIVDGAFSSGGTYSIKGTGWFEITASVLVSQANTGGYFDLASVISSTIGNVSTTPSVVRVTSASINNGATTQQLLLRGYQLSDYTYDAGVASELLGASPTSVNFEPVFAQNSITLFTIGTTLNITFYVLAPSISETIQFTNGRGTLYSEYKYTRIDRIDLISGFLNPSTQLITGNLRVARSAQPLTSSTYFSDYSYFGPVENEVITIVYRYNNVIQDATAAIEEARTLTADVLARLALTITVNISMTVILTSQAINQQAQIIDSATSAVNSLITSAATGSTLDYSGFLRVVTAISGVQGADVTLFDYVGSLNNGAGNLKSIQADANEYFIVGLANITAGTR